MSRNRKTAIIVGVLFIIGTVSGVLSVILTGTMMDAPDFLVQILAQKDQFLMGALFVLLMGLSLAMVPVMMFPILKKQDEALALGYVVFRGALEASIDVIVVISWLLLLTASQGYAEASVSNAAYFQNLGQMILDGNGQISLVLTIVFTLGSMLFNYLLYQSKLVPRWLSAWGLIGVALHCAEGLLSQFGLLPPGAETIAAIPIGLQEMVFAVWLIVKGFNPLALTALSKKQND